MAFEIRLVRKFRKHGSSRPFCAQPTSVIPEAGTWLWKWGDTGPLSCSNPAWVNWGSGGEGLGQHGDGCHCHSIILPGGAFPPVPLWLPSWPGMTYFEFLCHFEEGGQVWPRHDSVAQYYKMGLEVRRIFRYKQCYLLVTYLFWVPSSVWRRGREQ